MVDLEDQAHPESKIYGVPLKKLSANWGIWKDVKVDIEEGKFEYYTKKKRKSIPLVNTTIHQVYQGGIEKANMFGLDKSLLFKCNDPLLLETIKNAISANIQYRTPTVEEAKMLSLIKPTNRVRKIGE